MARSRGPWVIGVVLLLHLGAATVLGWASLRTQRAPAPRPPEPLRVVQVSPAPLRVEPPPPAPIPPPVRSPRPAPRAESAPAQKPLTGQAFMEAPPAPSAQDWAQAATYTLKNAKRYRHHWSQHVRSLMGTAHEGPEQGAVRFRIEIAPSGALARLDTIWSTSEAVEQRARRAVQQLPPLPPTPNGQPLIFEKTIVFDAFTAEAPPIYKNDCEPDPPQHRNRFTWDGRSPQVVAEAAVATPLDPEAYAECLKRLPQDSLEAEAGHDQRQLEQWRSQKLGR